ncbi:MAG TPA: sigma-70 family RNA polymerase sigma factor [Planctomycetota bacterium]
MTGELERAFLEFRERGDARAMARVFDGTAQELLLVAANLARRGGEAEELVQETYLEALRRPQGWDAARPLLPWLLGILVQKQRAARRQRAEQHARERDLEAAEEHVARSSPLGAAEDADLALHLDSALRALPEAYRACLTLRLVHGLEPVQIAHALGRPLETVRTQLRRGKELLRAALPRSLAGLIALDVEGTSALRRQVLEEAGRIAAGSTLAVTGGALVVMKKLGAAVLVLVGAGFLWWQRSAQGGGAGTDAPAPLPLAELASPAAELSRAPTPREPSAREAVASTPPSAALAGGGAELLCRVRWDSDGTPAAGVALELRHAAFGPVTPLPRATSDAEGLARFPALPAGDVLVQADRGGDAEATLVAGANELELRIPRGLEVAGVVLDSRDLPVAGAELWISGHPFDEGCGQWVAGTGADGRFLLRDVGTGRALTARAPGRPPEPGIRIEGQPGERIEVTLRVGGAGSSVAGVVRDSQGAPVAGAQVFLGYRLDGRYSSSAGVSQLFGPPPEGATTDASGRFEAHAVTTRHPLPVWACAEGFAVWHGEVPVHESGTWVEIELVPAVRVHGVVRDDSDRPIAGVEVLALPAGVDPRSALDYGPGWSEAQSWSATDGSFRLERVPPGPTVLLARGQDGEARAEVELVAGEARRWDARLESGGEIAGMVVDEAGTPLAGLEVFASAGDEGEARSNLRAETDAAGEFRLGGAVRERYLLRVREPKALLDAPLYHDGVAPGTEALELVFPERNRASARFEGRLLDAEGAPFPLERLELRRIEPDSTLRTGSHRPRTTDGRFTTELVPAGRYVLATSSPAAGRWTIGTFELAAGEVRDIGTHACPAPGRIACEVLDVDGAPLLEGEVWALGDDSEMGYSARIVDGRGTTGPVPPGVYWIGFEGYEQPLVRNRVEVRAGEVAHTVLRLPRALPRWIQTPAAPGRSFLRFVWEWRREGELVNRHGSVIGPGPQRPLEMWLVPGRYEVVFTLEDGRSTTTSFEVSPATTGPESAVILRSPLDP